jgi:hypothetical protein
MDVAIGRGAGDAACNGRAPRVRNCREEARHSRLDRLRYVRAEWAGRGDFLHSGVRRHLATATESSCFVSGHGFSRAARYSRDGALAPAFLALAKCVRQRINCMVLSGLDRAVVSQPAGAEAQFMIVSSARLKPCPDTRQVTPPPARDSVNPSGRRDEGVPRGPGGPPHSGVAGVSRVQECREESRHSRLESLRHGGARIRIGADERAREGHRR